MTRSEPPAPAGPSPDARALLARALGEAIIGSANLEGLLVCERDWRVSFRNAAAAALLGLTGDAPDAPTLWGLQPALAGTTAELQLRRAMAGREAVEFVSARPGAIDEWIEIRTLPLPERMAFLVRDVTGRERTERHLRSTNASLRLAHTAAKAATWEWRPSRPLRWIDPAAARALVGMPSRWDDEADIEDWRRRVRPEDIQSVNDGVAQLAARGEGRFEFRVRAADGTERWLESHGVVAERGPKGAPLRVIGITVDVTERKAVEETLRTEIEEREKAQAHQRLLIHELNHRVKNTLATVQSIALQSLRGVASDEAFDIFTSRLMALGWAHDLLNRQNWEGADLDEIVRRMAAAHDDAERSRILIEGPAVRLAPNKAVAMAMALHELATNATKYGALSTPKGKVAIRWRIEEAGAQLALDWRERGGPAVSEPRRRGFGSRLIERSLAAELGGEAHLTFAPTGVVCELTARL